MAAYYAALRLLKRKRKRNNPVCKNIIKDLQNPFSLDERTFKQKFCLSQEGVFYVNDLIGPIMKRNQGYPVELQILSSLQVMGSGCFQSKIGAEQILHLSQATVSRNLDAFVDALLDIVPRIIEFPSPTELAFMDPKFYGQSKIRNIIGLVDCVHILINKPHVPGCAQYLNGNYEYSINMQLVCNSDLYILDAIVMWPGSISNSTIWYDSSLRNMLKDSNMPNSYLLGDSTFPLEPWLLVPYIDCQRSEELIFNDHVHRALTIAQECSATLRKRFKCLHHKCSPLHYFPEKCCKIITACCVLHNICLKLGISLNEPVNLNTDVYNMIHQEVEYDNEETMLKNEAMAIRDEIAKKLIS